MLDAFGRPGNLVRNADVRLLPLSATAPLPPVTLAQSDKRKSRQGMQLRSLNERRPC